MANEDQIPRGSLNRGDSSKKLKQTKAPQRGPGMQKLHQMMLEKQREKLAADNISSSLPIPHSNQSSSSVSVPSVYQADLSPPNTITRQPLPSQTIDVAYSPLIIRTSPTAFESPRPIIAVPEFYGPNIWNPGLPFQSSGFHPYISRFGCPPNQFTHASSSTSINRDLSTSSSSMRNFPMEHPSNQNYHHGYLSMQRQEKEEIRGVKRPYHLLRGEPSGLLSNYGSRASVQIRDSSTLYENSGSLRNLKFRDSPSTFAQNTNEENNVSGDFLTLANPSANPASRHGQFVDLSLLPCQPSHKNMTFKFEELSRPATATPTEQAESKNIEETDEDIDLDLKL